MPAPFLCIVGCVGGIPPLFDGYKLRAGRISGGLCIG